MRMSLEKPPLSCPSGITGVAMAFRTRPSASLEDRSVMTDLIKIEDLVCGFNDCKVLKEITVAVDRGAFIGIIGPNASGKTTLLRTVSGVLKPISGEVVLEGQNVHRMKRSQLAKKLAFVTQVAEIDFDFTVEDIVTMGRTPHCNRFQRLTPADKAVVKWAMEITRTGHLSQRSVTELSGGEKQRVLIAQALAQDPDVLLLDEPTSYLDINHQIEIMDVLKRLNRKGLTVIMTLHDLNLAAQYCNYLLLLSDHRIYASGKPKDVITAENIRRVYGNDVLITVHPTLGCPQVTLSPKLNPTESKGFKVHLVAGGGMASQLMGRLVMEGYEVTVGVLNHGDGDWMLAKELGLFILDIPAFVDVDDEASQRNLEMMTSADVVLVGDVPFGHGNLGNLRTVCESARAGVPIVLLEKRSMEERDYTGGVALNLYSELLNTGCIRVNNEDKVIEVLHNLAARKSTLQKPCELEVASA